MKSLNTMSAVSLVLIILFLFAPHANTDSSVPKARVLYTCKAPVIDGKKDGVWSKAQEVKIKHYLQSDGLDKSDLSATFETLWDDARFYCFVTVRDENLVNFPELDPWLNDGVEVYLDGDNSKNDGWYDGNDEQLRFELWEPPTSWHGNVITDNIIYAYKTTRSGYNLEFSIPLSDLYFVPENWHAFGLEVIINDNDGGSVRDETLAWWTTSLDWWQNPSLWGTAVLLGKPRGLGKEMANTDISISERFDLLPNYPNPFNPTTNIQYQLPVDATVEILIYNMAGQKIRFTAGPSSSAAEEAAKAASYFEKIHEYRLNGRNLTAEQHHRAFVFRDDDWSHKAAEFEPYHEATSNIAVLLDPTLTNATWLGHLLEGGYRFGEVWEHAGSNCFNLAYMANLDI